MSDNHATLIDTGIPNESSIQQIRNVLEQNGLSFKSIDKIILTHMHTDHSGGVEAIQQEVAVPVYVHSKANEVINGDREIFDAHNRFFDTFIEQSGAKNQFSRKMKYRGNVWKDVHYIEEKDRILVGNRCFTVLYVPGHSQTDICLWDQNTGEAIVGDHLLGNISANAFIEPPGENDRERPRPLLQYRKSMERMKNLPFTKIYPGHGDPYEGHEEVIFQRFIEQDERCIEISNVLKSGKKTVYEISSVLFPWLKGGAIFLGLSEIQGHLDLMKQRLEVKVEQHENILIYHPV